jgi:hypothetical protein
MLFYVNGLKTVFVSIENKLGFFHMISFWEILFDLTNRVRRIYFPYISALWLSEKVQVKEELKQSQVLLIGHSKNSLMQTDSQPVGERLLLVFGLYLDHFVSGIEKIMT